MFELKLDVLQVESNPRLLRVLPSDEAVILSRLRACLGRTARHDAALPALPDAGTHRRAERRRTSRQRRDGPSRRRVEVGITLAETQIAADELADLRVGDIIATETAADSPAIVSIEGRARFRAKPGVYQGRKAVRITEPIEAPAAAPPDQPSA